MLSAVAHAFPILLLFGISIRRKFLQVFELLEHGIELGIVRKAVASFLSLDKLLFVLLPHGRVVGSRLQLLGQFDSLVQLVYGELHRVGHNLGCLLLRCGFEQFVHFTNLLVHIFYGIRLGNVERSLILLQEFDGLLGTFDGLGEASGHHFLRLVFQAKLFRLLLLLGHFVHQAEGFLHALLIFRIG